MIFLNLSNTHLLLLLQLLTLLVRHIVHSHVLLLLLVLVSLLRRVNFLLNILYMGLLYLLLRLIVALLTGPHLHLSFRFSLFLWMRLLILPLEPVFERCVSAFFLDKLGFVFLGF